MPKITNHGGPTILGASWVDEDEPVPPEPTVTQTPPPDEPEPDYEVWTVEQLKTELGERGLPKTGRHDDLVLRLLEDDEAEAE